MILAAIEWQGGSFEPIEDTLKRLSDEGRDVRTLILNSDNASLLKREDDRQYTRHERTFAAIQPGPGGTVWWAYRDPNDQADILIFIAAAAGNGQILFSDVPAREGMRLSEFR